MSITTAANVQALAALLTFAAACVAVYATLQAPARAARLAEQLRIQNEGVESRRREKYRVFQTMMDYRGRNIADPESVNALNMINVVFHDDKTVRDAFEDFLGYADGAHFAVQRSEGYIDIILEIAKVLGFSEYVTRADINRGYFPH